MHREQAFGGRAILRAAGRIERALLVGQVQQAQVDRLFQVFELGSQCRAIPR